MKFIGAFLFTITFMLMKDNFSKQASVYAKYRPTYPPALFDFILKQIKNKQAAWDCGTGNGQAAKELAKHFEKVFGTDISQKQIDNAYKASNIFSFVSKTVSINICTSKSKWRIN